MKDMFSNLYSHHTPDEGLDPVYLHAQEDEAGGVHQQEQDNSYEQGSCLTHLQASASVKNIKIYLGAS